MGGQANTPTNNDYQGQSATTSLGNISIAISSNVFAASQQLQTSLENVSVSSQQIVSISGFSANITLGSQNLWQPIEGANNTWTSIAA